MDLISFKGWKDTIALFEIDKDKMPDSLLIDKIIVSHEGDWLDEDAMICHRPYRNYEDVQAFLGKGLWFLRKWYSPEDNRSNFEFKFVGKEALLAVPATGEEIDFEIYGMGYDLQKHLLLKREL